MIELKDKVYNPLYLQEVFNEKYSSEYIMIGYRWNAGTGEVIYQAVRRDEDVD